MELLPYIITFIVVFFLMEWIKSSNPELYKQINEWISVILGFLAILLLFFFIFGDKKKK